MSADAHEPTAEAVKELTLALCDDTITAAEMETLDHWLTHSAAARQVFRATMELHAELALRFRPVVAPISALLAEPPPPRPSSWPRRRLAAACTAVVALLALASWFFWPRPALPTEEENDSLGYLSCAPGCSWRDSVPPGPLQAGQTLDLVTGFAEVHLSDGVHLLLEGPVRVRLVSATQVELQHGQLRAEVPPARAGFVVSTPTASVIDRGTEFAVRANPAGKTEVAVYRGLVECLALDQGGEVVERVRAVEGQRVTVHEGRAEVQRGTDDDGQVRRRFGHSPGLWAYWRFEDDVPAPEAAMATQLSVLGDSSGYGRRLDYWPGGPEGIGRYRYSSDVPPAGMFRAGFSGGQRSFDAGALPADAPGVLSCGKGTGDAAVLVAGFTLEGFYRSRGDQSGAGSMALLYQGEKYQSYLVGLNHKGPGVLAVQLVGAASGQLLRPICTLEGHNFASGAWYYFAVRYRPATGNQPGQLRLDALSEAGRAYSSTCAIPPGFRIATSTRPLLFGRVRYYRNEKPKQHFRGLLDEIRFSSAILEDQHLLGRLPASRD